MYMFWDLKFPFLDSNDPQNGFNMCSWLSKYLYVLLNTARYGEGFWLTLSISFTFNILEGKKSNGDMASGMIKMQNMKGPVPHWTP